MNVLVTGNLGYIGAVLTKQLLNLGFSVTGFDSRFFFDKSPYADNENFKQIIGDLRKVKKEDLEGVDAICHLAALSNDPCGDLAPNITDDINHLVSVKIAKLAKEIGIPKFVFSSSCSIYGVDTGRLKTEESELEPLTAYAKSKVDTERDVKPLADKNFAPTFLRNSTVYGASPFMRFDLVVNHFAGQAFTTGKIQIYSDGTPWRPNIHIEDVSNAFIAVLKEDEDVVRGESFNIGRNDENYQVKQIAEIVASEIPAEIECLDKTGPDKRSYKIDFTKASTLLKHFKPEWTIKRGTADMKTFFEKLQLTKELFESDTYVRLKHLKKLIDKNILNDNLEFIKT